MLVLLDDHVPQALVQPQGRIVSPLDIKRDLNSTAMPGDPLGFVPQPRADPPVPPLREDFTAVQPRPAAVAAAGPANREHADRLAVDLGHQERFLAALGELHAPLQAIDSDPGCAERVEIIIRCGPDGCRCHVSGRAARRR